MRPEKERQQEIKKPSALDVETENLDANRLKLVEEEEEALKLANELLEIGKAYIDKKAPGLRIKLKKDNSIIFSSDFATEEDFAKKIKKLKQFKES